MPDLGIYIHFPFCRSKCGYCDFNSYPDKIELAPFYIKALKEEMTNRSEDLKKNVVVSVFWGGGTPSLLSLSQLREITDLCFGVLNLSENAEITIEANPRNLYPDYLKGLKDLGFNRLSLGVQSLSDKYLQTLGRNHSSQEIFSSVESARKAGFDNLSPDMIFGIPGEDVNGWREDLEKAIELNPDHISTYNLTIEEGTRLYDQVKKGMTLMPPEDDQTRMYETGIEILADRGYNQYEISNFSREGKECRHNKIYWENGEYAGFGAGAFSYLGGERTSNINSPEEYINALKDRKDPIVYRESLSRDKMIRESVIMNLRLTNGIEKNEFRARFGCEIEEILGREISLMCQEGLLTQDGSRIRLSRKGTIFSNNVFMELV